MNLRKIILLAVISITLSACDHPEELKQRHISKSGVALAVGHIDRPQADTARDKVRLPEKVLTFFKIQSGDRVAELLAADGYYTELLSRCVGEKGKVYMQNNQKFYDFQTDRAVNERLADNRLPNVVRWDKELSDLGFEAQSLDKLLMVLVLHDFYWMEQDVSQIIQQAYISLKPGGILGVVDHAAVEGSGAYHASDMHGLHRIDKNFVIKQMQEAGFILDGDSDALAQPDDDRTQAFFSADLKGKPTDRFMLRFRKPA
ncbi:class I SAM-dependent methyltransferase [Aliikangiella coralliicola]|uniref:Class I SAM-dependent methyltransferase n=1 Tax=Aliikangiella coralliicola TaxID=2592383 RepID=A0A545UEW6_9GAMM|nr:class I SAM-dependent methyltransferase [Aliikangiella coralliicola]TQV87933.1 class I SAM-dependent methyltransferase [Aliikangiella coralliicola]